MKIDKKLLEQLFRSCSNVNAEHELKKPAISIWQSENNNYSEESLNNSDNQQIPACKNAYKDGLLIARYQYDSSGQIIQRINFENSVPTSVTKYNNGIEVETIKLYTYSNGYSMPDMVFDQIIDPIFQDKLTTDCWFLNALSVMSKKPWGMELIRDAISYDTETGNVTIKFKHAYGETKEFTITTEELEEARQAKVKWYGFGEIPEGTTVYIDGKRELYTTTTDEFSVNSDMVQKEITFIEPDGESFTYTKEQLEEDEDGNFEGSKYSAGDLTVLALEIAADKSCNEAGFNLGDGAGSLDEVISLFSDKTVIGEYYSNSNVRLKEENSLSTESQKKRGTVHLNTVENMQETSIADLDNDLNPDEIKQKLYLVKNNPENYMSELIIKMPSGGWHAAEILRFEEKDGREYITYAQPWNQKAEITEDLDSFVNNTLSGITLIKLDETIKTAQKPVSADESFRMGCKSNKTNFVSAVNALKQNAEFEPDIKKEQESYIITINGEKITVTESELETAKLSGRYSTGNDEVSLLEIALERYINKTKHENTISNFMHTNLEDIPIQEILNLLSNDNLKVQNISNLKQAINKEGLKFAVSNETYYAIKDIKQTADNKYIISVIQPEDTSVVITYTEEEFKKLFNRIEIYY